MDLISLNMTAHRPLDPRHWLRQSWHHNRPLTLAGVAMLAALVVALVGVVIDPRVITGVPAWLKPAKFAVSLSIYSFTFVWLLSFVKGHPWLVSLVGNATAVASTAEMVIIGGQVVRGTTSHFNNATPLDTVLYQAMSVFVVVLWTMTMLLAVLLIRQRFTDRAFAWSLRLGVLAAVLGMGVAFLMTSPSALQQQARDAGQPTPISGAHSVGIADGGAGLPVVGWNTEGGDLRVGHFVGLHALQVLPVVGLLLGWLAPRWLPERSCTALVVLASVTYTGWVVLLTWQALRGQSVIAPDAQTLVAYGGLIGGFAVLSVGVVIAAWRTRDAPATVVVEAK